MVNKVILIGRVGKDPEVRSFDSGVKKASFTLATSESFRSKDGSRSEQTEWHNIVIWRNLADIVERFVKKGSLLYLEGRIRYRSWEDASGQKRYTTDIECDVLKLLDKKGDTQGDFSANASASSYSAPSAASATPSFTATPIANGDMQEPVDDLPF